jgi:hypothetical protein
MSHLPLALLIGFLSGLVAFCVTLLFNGSRRVKYAAFSLFGAGLITALFPGVPFAETGCGVAMALGVLIICSAMSRRSMLKSMRMAPALRDYGLENFDRLDFDRDGLISRWDLEIGLSQELSTQERQLMRRLAWDLWHVGHVIDTFTSVAATSGSVVVIDEYGASPEDLRTYPERIARKYKQEFGEN